MEKPTQSSSLLLKKSEVLHHPSSTHDITASFLQQKAQHPPDASSIIKMTIQNVL